MKNRLSNFESFVHKLFTDHPFSKEKNNWDNWQDQIELEKKILMEAVYDLLFAHQDDPFVTRVLKVYHIRLTAISNHAYEDIREEMSQGNSPKKPDSLFAIKLYVLLSIDQLLEAAFAILPVQSELIAPEYNVDVTGRELLEAFHKVSRRLKRNMVPPSIIKILQDFFGEIDSSRAVAFNYRQLEYAQKVSRGIHKMLRRDPVGTWPDKIWQMLIHMNFNRESAQQYSKQHMYTKAISDKPANISLIELELLRKDIEGIDVDENWAYDPGHYPLKRYILDIIGEEVHWTEKNILELEKEIVRQNKNYFLMDITERQLNLLALINLKLNKIPYHSHRHVLKVLSIFIRPIRNVPMSFRSVSKKSVGSDKSTVRGLYAYLMSMVEYIRINHGDLLH
ncbi:hypothetical protein [Chitinophaga sp. MM2321]|uniref:hypothetical protein n=1 Tax=Chitinophaga sp. MM2321 TaxID=3137178 RepID=UPI0032D56A1A